MGTVSPTPASRPPLAHSLVHSLVHPSESDSTYPYTEDGNREFLDVIVGFRLPYIKGAAVAEAGSAEATQRACATSVDPGTGAAKGDDRD